MADCSARAPGAGRGRRRGDVTTAATVPPGARAVARIVQKAPGVIFGLDAAEVVFSQLDPEVEIERQVDEGEWREQGGPVLTARGDAAALLTGERTALNFLAHLSGVATISALAARAVEGTGATVLDTRKTTPGLRTLEKEAVAAGGATNHRAGLYDAILIKENHIAAGEGGIAGRGPARASGGARAGGPARGRGAQRGGDRRGARGGGAPAAARQHGPRRSCAPRSRRWAAARSSRRAAGSISTRSGRSPRRG